VLEESHENGKAVGIVTTAYLSHATPASTYAKSPNRYWYCDADLSDEAKKTDAKTSHFNFMVLFLISRLHLEAVELISDQRMS